MLQTANEFGKKLEIRLDRDAEIDSGYTDTMLSNVTNEAVWYYIKSFIDKFSNRKGYSIEETEARGQGFSPLISEAFLTLDALQDSIIPNAFYYTLPEDFMFSLLELPIIENNVLDVDIVPSEEYSRLVSNYYRKPFYKCNKGLIFRMYANREIDGYTDITQVSNKRHLYTVPQPLTELRIRYLRLPPQVVIDNENPTNQRHLVFDLPVQDTLLDIAVSLQLDKIKEGRVANIPPVTNFE